MSQTQISFAAFAQRPVCPPVGENEAEPGLAAPSASGQQAGTPLPYGGPWSPPRQVFSDFPSRPGRRDDMFGDWQFYGLLDAPDVVPYGGHRAFESCGEVRSDGYDARPGRWS
jgi:hypothetical protein